MIHISHPRWKTFKPLRCHSSLGLFLAPKCCEMRMVQFKSSIQKQKNNNIPIFPVQEANNFLMMAIFCLRKIL
jgi:hypothetical protein